MPGVLFWERRGRRRVCAPPKYASSPSLFRVVLLLGVGCSRVNACDPCAYRWETRGQGWVRAPAQSSSSPSLFHVAFCLGVRWARVKATSLPTQRVREAPCWCTRISPKRNLDTLQTGPPAVAGIVSFCDYICGTWRMGCCCQRDRLVKN